MIDELWFNYQFIQRMVVNKFVKLIKYWESINLY